MISVVELSKFSPIERSFVFSITALIAKKREGKRKEYKKRVVESIKNGEICALFTPLELRKIRNYSTSIHKKIYNILKSPNSKVFCVKGDYLNLKGYEKLYDLFKNKNLHAGDLSTVILAMEYQLPLITDDKHYWILRQNFEKVYKEKYGKRMIFEMYTSKDFVDFYLNKS